MSNIPDKDKLLTYERTPCFGTCPSYKVTLLKNGRIFFEGKNFVPFLDTAIVQIPQSTLGQIKAIMDNPSYLLIEIKEPEYHVTDIPGLNFTDYEHKRDYELDQVIPQAIRIIVDKIDKVLENEQLLYDKKLYPRIQKEILVELKPGTDPYSIDGKDEFYQLSYRDDIGAHIFKYELICAEKEIEKALTAIKQRKGVREAQLNHKLDRR